MGIYSNDLADSLAKEAIKKDLGNYLKALVLIGMDIKDTINKEQQDIIDKAKAKSNNSSSYYSIFNTKPSYKLLILRDIERPIASVFYQLKIGYSYFKTYLLYTKKLDNSTCRCRYPKETPIHLLLSCKDYREERKLLKRDIPLLSIKNLFKNQENIKAILAFIKNTKIATKQWYNNR